MASAVEDRLRAEDVRAGAYIRNGRALRWVAGTFEDKVVLENCLFPDRAASVVPLEQLLEGGWALVRAASPR